MRHALATGDWVELWPGVVVPGGDVHDPMTRGAAALLRAGPSAVLSAGTAVAMHGCSAAEALAVEVTVPYDRQVRSRPGFVVHQGRVAESDVVELDGLRTQALDVALAELLCRGDSQRRALSCLHQAMKQADEVERDVRGSGHGAESLRAMVAERVARRRDRRGTRRAAAVLELARDPRVCARVSGWSSQNREVS